MSKMKSTLAAMSLTLVLAVPALAGNIGTPGGTPPPPPPPTVNGNIGTPGAIPPPPPEPTSEGPCTPGSELLIDILIAVFSLF
jgi:hypothetical protein